MARTKKKKHGKERRPETGGEPREAPAAEAGGAADRSSWRRIVAFWLVLVVATAAGMAALPATARWWMNRMPRNYAARAADLARTGRIDAALDLLLEETERNIYNFDAFYKAAELAAYFGSEVHCRRALDAMLTAFDRFEAVRHRDVFTRSWDEPKGLALVALLFARLGDLDDAAMLAHAAQTLDPVRVPLLLRDWARKYVELFQTVTRVPPPAKADPAEDLPGRALWSAAAPDGMERLAEAAGGELPGLYASGEGEERFILLSRRGRFRLPIGEAASAMAEGGPVVLHVVAKGTPAFGAWPVVFVRQVDADGSPGRAVGAFTAGFAEARRYTIGPFVPGDGAVEFFYYNDEFDPELKQDRNLLLHEITLAPAGSGVETAAD